MTRAESDRRELARYCAEINARLAKLVNAHRLRNPHDTDIVHFRPIPGDKVEIWWEADGEPPDVRYVKSTAEARVFYRNLRDNDDFDEISPDTPR